MLSYDNYKTRTIVIDTLVCYNNCLVELNYNNPLGVCIYLQYALDE